MKFEELIKIAYETLQEIDLSFFEKQQKELQSKRPLPEIALENLEDKLEIDEAHNSTAIEGNTLTLGETSLVLTKGLTIGGKTLKEHLEVKGYDKAYQYIRGIYDNIEEIDEKIILRIHQLVFADFTQDLLSQMNYGIGIYRSQPAFIVGSTFVPPNYMIVSDLMKFLIDFLAGIENDDIRKAILAHLGLVTIHPFGDGNGRTARLLMNLILLKSGCPIIVVKKERRGDYLNGLEVAQNNPKDKQFFNLMLEFLQQSFNLYKELY